MVPAPGTGAWTSIIVKGCCGYKAYLYINVYILPSRNVLPVHINDSMVIRDHTSPGGEGVANISAK